MSKVGKCNFKQLKKFTKHLKLQDEKLKPMLEKMLNDVAAEMLARTKERTPYRSGDLRRAWSVSNIQRAGACYKITVSNNLEYAPYVEYGHRTPGHTGWVQGAFMMTISAKEIEQLMPAVIKKRIETFLKQVMEYD